MRAMDVMTANVITVTPETSVRELAELLGKHGISGVPVVDADNTLVGIVSEGDLLHRTETGTERRTARRRPRWLDALLSDHHVARDYLKSHGRAVGDVMTRDVITVADTTSLDEIADLLESERIRRVPVVRDGKLIGIVSRANLVRALVTAKRPAGDGAADAAGDGAADAAGDGAADAAGDGAADAAGGDRNIPDDFAIRDALLAELRGKPWAKVWAAEIMVRNNVVHLWYSDDQPVEERQAIRVAAENTPGVAHVEEHLVHVQANPIL